MRHLSRLVAAVCAITVILVSLPTNAGIGDKDLPLLNGQKTKLLYTVVGVTELLDLVTIFHCTSTERVNGKEIQLGIEVFDDDGALANDVTRGFGVGTLLPGATFSLSTGAINAFVVDNFMSTGDIAEGSARIFATSKNVLCTAMLVDDGGLPPTSMVMLPVFRATKQGGM